MKDYPAAHSMDTEWFAVDACGNLAVFDSGEGGAVPESNDRVWQTGIHDFDDFLSKLSEKNEHRCIQLKTPGTTVAENLTLKELQGKIERTLRQKYQFLDALLLQLSSDEAIARLGIEEIEDNYAVRFAGEPVIVYVKKCSVGKVQKLVENRQILAGREMSCIAIDSADLFGFFVYGQDSWMPLPYTRTAAPIAPLRLKDLPENLQNVASSNCFRDLQFPDVEVIQPIEYMPCKTWYDDKRWVDTQGREHEEHPDYSS